MGNLDPAIYLTTWIMSAHFLSGTLDYVPKNTREVTFAPSETVKTVQVIIVNDNTTEPQEMFSGRLTPAVSPIVDIGQGEAVVVIEDDDSELVLPDSGTCSAYIFNSIRPVVMYVPYCRH